MEKKLLEENGEVGGVVAVNPKPKNGIAAKAIDWLEWVIVKLMHNDSSSSSHSNPLHYLSANFAPTHETSPCKDLPVIGHLPVSPQHSSFLSIFHFSYSNHYDTIIGNCFNNILHLAPLKIISIILITITSYIMVWIPYKTFISNIYTS